MDLTRTLGFLLLGASAALLSWLAVGVVELFTPLNKQQRLWVFVIILASFTLLSVPYVPNFGNPAARVALPCHGDGIDYDIRDGLCYKHVPTQFQRR